MKTQLWRMYAFVGVLPALGCWAHSPPASPSPAAIPHAVEAAPEDSERVLLLAGVRNGRDLGGLAGSRADIPANRFFRSANLSGATEADKAVLIQRGLKLDLDLRTVWEAIRAPDPLASDPRFHYVHISLLGVGLLDAFRSSRADLYVGALAHHQGQFRKIFHELAAERDGAVLFHCAAGKDRTGMVAALLLSLAGVDHDVIVHDYAISARYLHPGAEGDALARAIDDTPPSAIEAFLRELNDRFGGARAYLRTIGLSDDDVSVLLARLGQ